MVFNIRKCNAGIGIIQILFLMGIVAGISITILNLNQQTLKSGKSSEIRSEVRYFVALMSDIMNSPPACQGLFANKKVTHEAPTIVHVFDGSNPKQVEINDKDASGNTVKVYTLNVGGMYFRYYRLHSISLMREEEDPPEIFYMLLQFNILKQHEGKVNMPSKFISRFKGKADMSGDEIQDCHLFASQEVRSRSSSEGEEFLNQEQLLDIICAGPGAMRTGDTCTIYGPGAGACPADKPYFKGYALTIEGEDLGVYKPKCESRPLSTNDYLLKKDYYRCGQNKIQTGIDDFGHVICEDIPDCEELGHLVMKSDGSLKCVQLQVDTNMVEIGDGDNCGIRVENNVISFNCGCNTPPSCAERNAATCFGQSSPNNGCGGLCGKGKADCCAADPNDASRGSLEGQNCEKDEDCQEDNACSYTDPVCLPREGAPSRFCEGLSATECISRNSTCVWENPGPRKCHCK